MGTRRINQFTNKLNANDEIEWMKYKKVTVYNNGEEKTKKLIVKRNSRSFPNNINVIEIIRHTRTIREVEIE